MKKRTDTRQLLLDVTRDLMAERGYNALGIAEIVAAAGIPKGSFYYYFSSKDAFGQALLSEYFSDYLLTVGTLLNGDATAAERLEKYFRHWQSTQGTMVPHGRCLVVKLGAEVCDASEGMRKVIESGTREIINRIAACIQEGKQDGSISFQGPADVLASELYKLWIGASLMARIQGAPDTFICTLAMTKRLLG
jgi:TetR/AcrR family transcriptional regulator, transcriptional repressor for nem operon